jgi:hypothetical protein
MWHRRYGKWWMLQGGWDGWFSLGIHIDFRHRHRGDGLAYGPYVDFHIGWVIASLGLNPVYAGDIELHTSVAIGRELG